MAGAAERFLDSVSDEGRKVAQADFADEESRRDWHYIPRRRAGLAFAAMTATEQKAAYDLLATGLSLPAYAAATAIIALEDVLDVIEGGRGPRGMGTRPDRWGRHRADYSTTVFGDPTANEPWGWRFEGHHVSVNVAIVDGDVASTPLFLGANPAELTTGSGAVVTRPLGAEEDLALALLAALDDDQRETARIATDAPDDILSTNLPALDVGEPAGLRFADLRAPAHEFAEVLVRHYLDRLPAAMADQRWRQLESQLGDVAFAFAGQSAHRKPHYYRLQGPGLFVEYDNTQDDANHVHTVLRDPSGDFGGDLLRAHHAAHHTP
jgi:hypothetical protein